MAVVRQKLFGQYTFTDLFLKVGGRQQVIPVRHKVFNPLFIAPITDPKKLANMMETGEAIKLAHIPILPATNTDSVSVYNDPIVKKFTNYLMREGEKVRAQSLMLKLFERLKRYQLQKYHLEKDPIEKAKIEVEPLKIFHAAIQNCKPQLQLVPVKRGGATYQVPMPILESKSMFLAMNWLIEAGRQKDRKFIWSHQMALEMIDAAKNKGRVVKKKQDLHKQCEANRAYAHYRWS